MKVSILTYHWEDNYGATMQAYATYRAVSELGHHAEFIDLRLPYHPSLKQRIVFGLKRYRFNAFRKKFFKNLSERTYWSISELKKNPPESDCYLVGSDQTWNPQIARDLLPAFFLTFGDDNVRRVTYATSIGLNEWEESKAISNDEIKTALGKFNKILLREDSAIKIASNIFGAEAEQVVDPVLLFDSYSELTGDIKESGEAICYKLINDPGFYDKALSAAKGLNLPIRSIGSVRRYAGFRSVYPESVIDWIKRFGGARYVITDSFHGTVFSLLYRRPFVIYIGDPKRTTRIQSLLKQLSLDYRILSSENTSEDMIRILQTPIDWKEVDNRLSEIRRRSMELLSQALR